jgi:RNA polymerase sigma-19 factor, ECF subfamily
MSVERSRNDVPNGSSSNRMILDDAGFESLFKTHFTILCAYCQAKYSFDLDSAKESVHTGFIKLWENRNSISNEASIKAYLYKIVNNTCLDLIKHNKVKQRHENYVMQNAENATIYDLGVVDVKSLKETIDKAVSELPHQMRRIFVLSRYEGLKYAQIASLLNVSVKTVETQMSRSLLKLRQKLAKYIVICCLLTIF